MIKQAELPATIEEPVEAETPGVILRRARLASGLTKVQVAARLNMDVARIKALEQDKYHKLQGEVFVKGSLRAYGKLLELDCDALMDTYTWFKQANEAVSDLLEPVVASRSVVAKSNPLMAKWIGITLAMVVILLWFLQPADRVEGRQTEAAVVADGPIEVDIRDRSVIEALGGDSQQSKAQSLVTAVSEVQGSVEQGLLSLSFSGDCWVEVRDSEGAVIFADMRHAGDKLELTGQAPFKVLLGYAPVVSMNYNGESVNINRNTRTNSARFVVGRS